MTVSPAAPSTVITVAPIPATVVEPEPTVPTVVQPSPSPPPLAGPTAEPSIDHRPEESLVDEPISEEVDELTSEREEDGPRPIGSVAAAGGSRNLWALLGAIAAVVAIGSFLLFTDKRAILSRLSDGHLVTPSGDSAYDRWRGWVARNPSPSDQTQVAAAAVPRLRSRGDEILAELKSNNRESEATWAEAVSIFEWLSKLEPGGGHEAAVLFSQARLRFSKGEHAAALRDYYAAVEARPGWALALNGLARTLARMGDRSTAQQFYIKATQAEPTWIFPWLNLAAASLDLKDFAMAEHAAVKALSLDSVRASGHFFLARVYDDTRRYCQAVKAYKTAIEHAHRVDDPGFSIDTARRRIERLSAKYGCP